MSNELKENIQNLIHYYKHHKVDKMIETHPSFVCDDFTKLLKELEKELLNGFTY
jgi:hypothetical protein